MKPLWKVINIYTCADTYTFIHIHVHIHIYIHIQIHIHILMEEGEEERKRIEQSSSLFPSGQLKTNSFIR